MMTGKTTPSTLPAPPPKDCETRRRCAHELELPKTIESDSLSVGEAAIRRMPDTNSDSQDIREQGLHFVSRARRLESIQVLRAVAAVGVVFTHAITRIGMTFPRENQHSLFTGPGGQFTAGDAGVDLFFVISGLIMLYVHHDDFGQPGAQLNFLRKRLLRIVPIYWLLTTIAVVFLIFAPKLATNHNTGIDLPWILGSYLFLPIAPPGWAGVSPVIGVGWTLNYEMLFYAVFAASLALSRRRALQLICLCFVSMVALGTILKSASPLFSFVTNWLLLDFLMGVGIALWVLTKRKLSPPARRILLSIGIACIAATIIWTPPEEGLLRFLFWGVPGALIVFAICGASVPAGRLGRFASMLGDASYSIYLFQFFALPAWARAMAILRMDTIPFDVDVLILTGLVTASGVGCWFFLERPLGNMMRNFLRLRVSRLHHP